MPTSNTNTKRKSRSKYQQGERIKTIDELIDCEFIYLHHKVYHYGWYASWPLRLVVYYVRSGMLYKAERIGETV